jgi:hypothetical protein
VTDRLTRAVYAAATDEQLLEAYDKIHRKYVSYIQDSYTSLASYLRGDLKLIGRELKRRGLR